MVDAQTPEHPLDRLGVFAGLVTGIVGFLVSVACVAVPLLHFILGPLGPAIGGFVTSEATGAPIEGILAGGEDAGEFLFTGFFTLDDGYYELHGLRKGEQYKVFFLDFDRVFAFEYFDNRPNFASADLVLMDSAFVYPIDAALATSPAENPLTEAPTQLRNSPLRRYPQSPRAVAPP